MTQLRLSLTRVTRRRFFISGGPCLFTGLRRPTIPTRINSTQDMAVDARGSFFWRPAKRLTATERIDGSCHWWTKRPQRRHSGWVQIVCLAKARWKRIYGLHDGPVTAARASPQPPRRVRESLPLEPRPRYHAAHLPLPSLWPALCSRWPREIVGDVRLCHQTEWPRRPSAARFGGDGGRRRRCPPPMARR